MARNQDWKDRYRQVLEDRDRLARDYNDLFTELTRAVMRVSRAAEGLDPELDKTIGRIRNTVQLGRKLSTNTLAQQIDRLEEQLVELDAHRTKRFHLVSIRLSATIEQLRGSKPTRSIGRQLDRLDRQLYEQVEQGDVLADLLKEYAELQNQVLIALTGGQSPQSGIWQHLFGPRTTEQRTTKTLRADSAGEKQSDNRATPVTVQAHSQASATASGVPSDVVVDSDEPPATSEPRFADFAVPVSAALDELLDSVDAPSEGTELDTLYRSTRERLKRAIRLLELVSSIDDVRVLISGAFDLNNTEFGEYLRQLNERLAEASAVVHKSEQLSADRTGASRAFRDSVKDHVNSVNDALMTATALEQLKSELNLRIERLSSTVEEFDNQDQPLENALTEQLSVLGARVEQMEQQTKEAEQRVAEHRLPAFTDALTELPNRPAYENRLALEYDRWQRFGHPLTLAICDIDHFKQVNDNYGHLAGDRVLLQVAELLRKRLRKTDFVVRYGGEEFVMVMAETDCAEAARVLETLREELSATSIKFHDKHISVTASFGVTQFSTADEPDHVFKRADDALYRAKDAGRNRIEAF